MRDHTMFDFLVGEASTNKVDLQLINEFAKEAASAFLGSDKTPLNYSVEKLAKIEKLTPDQISLVCQEANKLVNTQMFKSAEDKYVTFDLASPEDIVSSLDPAEKTASMAVNDFDLAPNEEEKYFADFAITKTAGHNGLITPDSHIKRVTMEKLGSQLQDVKDDYIILNGQLEGQEKQFIKEARNHMLPLPLKERRGQFPYISKFCKEAGMSPDRTGGLMKLLDTVMVRQGLLEKSADMKADPELISDDLNARVVNGNHPLLITVKTISESDSRKEKLQDKHNLIQTHLADYDANGAVLGRSVKAL